MNEPSWSLKIDPNPGYELIRECTEPLPKLIPEEIPDPGIKVFVVKHKLTQ